MGEPIVTEDKGADRDEECKRDFVVTVYKEAEGGVRRAVLPLLCPFGGDRRCCRIGVHGRREREHGPGFPLVVAVCHAHGRHFTLYPPGWTPWGRVAVHAVGDDGAAAWDSTLFAAALDAAAGRLWPVESVGARGCGKTQARWVARCGGLLGLDGGRMTAERAACVLDVPLATALLAAAGFGSAADRRARGRAIGTVLRARTWGSADLGPLLAVGARSGVCGRAWTTGPSGVTRPVLLA